MTKSKFLIIIAGIVLVLAFAWFSLVSQSPTQVKPLVAVQNNQGGCSQCLGNHCYAAPCNLECRLVGDGCETIVMAGGMAGAYSPEVKANGGDYAEFFIQRVVRNNAAMEAAGIQLGDTVTRVNNIYAGSDLEFAKLVLSLPKGTVLTLLNKDSQQRNVTL
jgi:hypothetical protein